MDVPHFCKNVVVSALVKTDPWSHWISLGNPILANTASSAFTTAVELNSGNNTASGNFVAGQMSVSKYLLPAAVTGKGPTMSITNLRKGSPIKGTSTKGALSRSFGRPVLWQTLQERTQFSESLKHIGQ